MAEADAEDDHVDEFESEEEMGSAIAELVDHVSVTT